MHLRQSDAIAAIAHIYTAMRSLHMHTCTHTTCSAVRSLLLHTPTQRYDRCHCTHLHSDTIAVIACIYTAIRSLPMHMPAQRYDRSSWTHQYSDAIAVSAHTHLHSDTIVVNPMCIPHNDKITFIPMCTHTTIRSLPCPHMECKLECQCVQRSRSLCTI